MEPSTPVDASEREAWLIALRTPGLGAVRIRRLYDAFGSLQTALAAPHGVLREAGLPEATCHALAQASRAAIRPDLDWLAAGAHRCVLTLADTDYPPLLRRIEDAPPLLFIEGDVQCLWRAQIAVVGSRNASSNGLAVARDFATQLAGLDLVVTSGLAEGIDGAAHAACLDADGRTIAVCGTGLDRVYPSRHRELARRIAVQGALVSDFPIGTPPLPEHFPRRNRIIAALALATLVVEANERSGSLITARLAAEFGREVLAIPGSIRDPRSAGCHRLIRQGATLVTCIDDVVETLTPLAGSLADGLRDRLGASPAGKAPGAQEALDSLDPTSRNLWAQIDPAGTEFDELVARSGLTPGSISSILTALELEGLVANLGGGRFQKLA